MLEGNAVTLNLEIKVMKKLIVFLMLMLGLFSANLQAGLSLMSDSFSFDGSKITEDPILLLPTDKIAYSSALIEGTPVSLTVSASDTSDPEISAILFTDAEQTEIEGTISWDYTDEAYKDFPTDDTYLLTESLVSGENVRRISRSVNILPEPLCVSALLFAGFLFLRKKTKELAAAAAVIAAVSLCAFDAKAESSVTEVSCLQMWPFGRSVVVNYTVESDAAYGLSVKFYGTFDNGTNLFDLTEKGTLTKDGEGGTVPGGGKYKALWTPDESFFSIKSGGMKVMVEIKENSDPTTYMVVDLVSGETSYLSAVPEGGWTDEYKTEKLALKKIEPGTFTMGSPEDELGRWTDELEHSVTLTKPYYMAVFETTQRQYEIIAGTNGSSFVGALWPVTNVSYDNIRGTDKGASWPANNEVDADSFLGKLRAKINLPFDLPTEAQWEFACRAGTTGAWNNGTTITNEMTDGNLDKLAYYNSHEHGVTNFGPTTVGSYLPNAWGLYDMHGNIQEWCLDWYADYGSDAATDPKGADSGEDRMLRGGDWLHSANDCRSAERNPDTPYDEYLLAGFRLALALD